MLGFIQQGHGARPTTERPRPGWEWGVWSWTFALLRCILGGRSQELPGERGQVYVHVPVPPVSFSLFVFTPFMASDSLSREVWPESFLEPLPSF